MTCVVVINSASFPRLASSISPPPFIPELQPQIPCLSRTTMPPSNRKPRVQLSRPRQISNSLSGQIMWLPSRHRIPADLDPNLEEGAYHHPVIIMSRVPSPEGLVEILMITSMGARGIAQAHTPDWNHWLNYAPIKPATHPAMPDTQLCFPDNCPPLAKNSYVNIRQCYCVHLQALRPYRQSVGDPVLGRASLRSLKEASKFVDLYDPNTSKRLKKSRRNDISGSLPEVEGLVVEDKDAMQTVRHISLVGLLLLVLFAVVYLYLRVA
ncbi:hypothetical protein BDP81DRAFT_382489 [Colletotrichum phormii]|uniref:Uncharacterized protein n=1 Tax=Colletotrichum phormii TaxID=359342 RepID=A0AAJ0EAK4_9PEZI|nr:uncharacterized protein BDP81DRAFT_382489 [Colletotrichum phormii]KAK1624706.1 hypothetical protein BDP81DRAFT_382489 [Colletotrichum phormii]